MHISCKINFHGVGGGGWVGGVLDQMKIRLTQPQVELELGLSLATISFLVSSIAYPMWNFKCHHMPSKGGILCVLVYLANEAF